MAIRSLQQPGDTEVAMEQERGAPRRPETSRFEEARVEGWYTKERCYEFSRSAAPLLASARVVVEGTSPQSNLAIPNVRAGG